jgi:hypothetical protein
MLVAHTGLSSRGRLLNGSVNVHTDISEETCDSPFFVIDPYYPTIPSGACTPLALRQPEAAVIMKFFLNVFPHPSPGTQHAQCPDHAPNLIRKEGPMPTQHSTDDRMLEVIVRSPDSTLEDLVLECPDLTWNQVFISSIASVERERSR